MRGVYVYIVYFVAHLETSGINCIYRYRFVVAFLINNYETQTFVLYLLGILFGNKLFHEYRALDQESAIALPFADSLKL